MLLPGRCEPSQGAASSGLRLRPKNHGREAAPPMIHLVQMFREDDLAVDSGYEFSVTDVPFEAMPFTITWSVLAPVSQVEGMSNVAFVVPVVHTPIVEKL